MAITEFKAALNQVATERGIPIEHVLASIESALVSAYKKDYVTEVPVVEDGVVEDVVETITAKIDPETGEASVYNDGNDVTPSGFGRIAAQTAKQVILQQIRESEKQVIYDEFSQKVGTLMSGTIFRKDPSRLVLDLGRAHGILPISEQVSTETYRVGHRLKVYVKDVVQGLKINDIIVSRADAEFVRKLFEQEVPEIASGVVVIESIAREAGSRTKMAVYSSDSKIDPVGSCVGQKGVRVQSIISEIFGEKIDIIPFSPIAEKFIAASLSPARVTEVTLDEAENRAVVTVPEDQQSLAIGKEGQNARLANKLTKWKIDIKGSTGVFDDASKSGESSGRAQSSNVVGVWDAAIAQATKDIEGAQAIEPEPDPSHEVKEGSEDVATTQAE